ncbi:hypothetical protein Tco_0512487, partial [Tanacetum coccineum]
MAYTSNSPGSDTEGQTLSKANLESVAYQLGLESVKAYVFDSRSSDGDDNQINDRFKKDSGYHAVPPPLNGNYMPPLADLSFAGLDDSIYRPTANKTSASVSQVGKSITPPSNTSVEIPRVKSVRPSGVIIEDWVSDNDEDIFQSNDLQATNKPSFKKIEISNEKVNNVRVNGVNTAGQTTISAIKGNGVTVVKASAGCVWRPKMTDLNNVSKDNSGSWVSKRGYPQQALKNKGIFDSGCSRHMIGNKDFLIDYQDIDGGFVAFGRSARGGKIIGKGKIRTDKLDFKDVFFVKELKFNLFSVSQMCDKKNSVLFIETECFVLSPDFKLLDASQVLLRVPSQSNMYSFDLKNVVPSGDLTCLFAKAIIDESKLWHRRLNPLGKFDGKVEEGFLVGYTINSKAFRVFNSQTKKFEENLHVNFLENKPNVAGQGPNWLFDIDSLTNSMNSQPVTAWNQTNKNACPQEANGNTGLKQSVEEKNVSTKQYIVFPLWSSISSSYKSSDENDTADDSAGESPVQKPASENEQALKNVIDNMMDQEKEASEQSDAVRKEFEAQCNRELLQGKATKPRSTNSFNTVSTPVYAAST